MVKNRVENVENSVENEENFFKKLEFYYVFTGGKIINIYSFKF